MIRRATFSDVPWLLSLALDCYRDFDAMRARKWLEDNMENPKLIVLMGEASAAIAGICTPFWRNESDCEIEFIASRRTRFGAGEIMKILKEIDDLRKSKGCARLYFNSRLADIGPFAKRMGATLAGTSYVLGV